MTFGNRKKQCCLVEMTRGSGHCILRMSVKRVGLGIEPLETLKSSPFVGREGQKHAFIQIHILVHILLSPKQLAIAVARISLPR